MNPRIILKMMLLLFSGIQIIYCITIIPRPIALIGVISLAIFIDSFIYLVTLHKEEQEE